MERNNYWTRRIQRRRMLQGAGVGAVGAAALGLVGCGDDDDSGSTSTATAAATTAAATGTGTAAATKTGTAAAAGKKGGIYVSQSANVYESVDPQRTVASPVLQVLARVQSKLLRFSNPNTGDMVGDLAEKWENPDASTINLTIRQGVKWHSAGPGAKNPAAAGGRAFTTEDVKYNIERQKAGLLASGEKGSFGRNAYWKNVDTVTISGNTVTLKLTKPDATFIGGLANEFNLMCQKELIEAVEPKATEISADKVIGTGPNILTEWVPGKSISAVRNPDYYNKERPYLDGNRWIQTFEDPTAYRIAFEQKQVDSFTDPDPGQTTKFWEANKDKTRIKYAGVANTVAIYLPRAQAPWKDDRLIQAINLAADRRQLIQQLHSGLGKVSGPVTWLQDAWAIPQTDLEKVPGYKVQRDQDLKDAKALWDAAGGADIGEITWVVPDTWASRAAWSSTPEIIAEMFNKAFGTTQFKARTKNYTEIIPSWFSKNFDPFFGWIPNVEIPDARAEMVGAFTTGSTSNIWDVSEATEIDAKLTKSLTLTNKDEAIKLVREVQDFVLTKGQFGRVIMYNYIAPTLYWNYVNPTGPSAEEGWNLISSSLDALDLFIDTDDPSYKGRATPTITGL